MEVPKRIEIIRYLFIEAQEYWAKGDTIKSSEELYKASEECIKALSEHLIFLK
jgi:hypothetical protein